MTCFMCKGNVQDGYSSFTSDMGDCIVVVKNVPSRVCGLCGETTYSDEVARQLESIVKNITTAAADIGYVAEIAVVNYSEKAA